MEWVIGLATVVLVVITGYYAWQTKKLSEAANASLKATQETAEAAREQAKANLIMAEEMKRSRDPSVTIIWGSVSHGQKQVSVDLKNEGLGPALNPNCYLTHSTFKFKNKPQSIYTTFEIGKKHPLSLPSEEFDLTALEGLVINCDYGSIRGERFRSTLRCEPGEKRTLKIITLNDEDRIHDQRSHRQDS